jgi:iron complex outermembrane receptor protein
MGAALIVLLTTVDAYAEPEKTVEEIVITATKRETTLQSTAGSIYAIGQDDIALRGVVSIDELGSSVPGLTYGEVIGVPQITIRGIGLSVETGAAEQGVASYLDGVFLSQPALTNIAVGDLERIEVLRGPQGTLQGRNATGGAVNYVTRRPTDAFEASASIGSGNYAMTSAEGFVSGSVVPERLRARAFVRYKEHEGYTDNRYAAPLTDPLHELEESNVRLALGSTVTDTLSIDVAYNYFRKEGSFAAYQMTNTLGVPLDQGLFTTEPFEFVSDTKNRARQEGEVLSTEIALDLGELTLRSVTGLTSIKRDEYSDGDGRGPSPTLRALRLETDLALARTDDFDTFVEDLTLSGRLFDRVDFVLGAFYMREDGSSTLDVELGPNSALDLGSFVPPPDGPLVTQLLPAGSSFVQPTRDEDNESYALYADVSYSLTDRLRVIGGFRVGADEKDVELSDPGILGYGECGSEPHQEFDFASPKLGVEYDVAEDVMVYGQYQEATKPGGVNASVCVQTFDDEEVKAFEVGIKSRFWDGRATLNVAAFDYDYDNYQVFQVIFPSSAEIVNAPKASVRGLEVEAALYLSENVSFDLGVSLLDAEYDEFDGDDPFIPGLLLEDLSGNRLNRAPEYTVSAGVDITVPIPAVRIDDLRVRAEVIAVDEMYFRQFNQGIDRQEEYTVGNLFVSLPFDEGRYELNGFVRNVWDEDYVIGQVANASAFLFAFNPVNTAGAGEVYGLWGTPRTWGVELRIQF